ncbi:MAG TPA: sulfatase-like hydrolase/transferase [Pirellulales bacterium]|jgi:arylsulfatase A-like enzyme|nr:sulfatase-like hydrolase/transferase [Pirellulales bacterium]
MNAIVVVVDRLHVGYLGCYGNTWVATPELNRLCVESFTFDQAIADIPSLEAVYASFWSGSHVLQRSGGRLGGAALPAALAKTGVAATLISDDRGVSQHPLAADFGETIEVEPPQEDGAVSADDAGQTHLAGYFALAADWLERARRPFCLWLHTRGLAAPWDAPLDLRNQYADADEAPPPPLVDVPCRWLADDFDPDERFGVCQAYAGQVSLLDACLGGLLAAISDGPFHEETLLTFVSPRGFPLGEHRRIGPCDDALYNELIHVPWLLRLPDGCGAAARSQSIVAPADLCSTLCDWWGIAPLLPAGTGRSLLPIVRNEIESLRDRACVAAPDGEQGIRTSGWYLRLPAAGPEGRDVLDVDRAELYAKPDDCWELNDVADRCRDTVEALRRGLNDFRTAAESGTIADLPPLDGSLAEVA